MNKGLYVLDSEQTEYGRYNQNSEKKDEANLAQETGISILEIREAKTRY